MDTHTVYRIKGNVIWALGPKAKHEVTRGQWGGEIKDVNLPDLLTLLKKTLLPVRNVFHSRAQFFNMKQDRMTTKHWTNIGNDWWTSRENAVYHIITAEEIITYKFARHGEHNAIIVKRWDILPRCANPRPSTGKVKHRHRVAVPNHGQKLTIFNPSNLQRFFFPLSNINRLLPP